MGGARLAGTGRASSFGAMESEFRDFSRLFSSSTESTADAVVEARMSTCLTPQHLTQMGVTQARDSPLFRSRDRSSKLRKTTSW